MWVRGVESIVIDTGRKNFSTMFIHTRKEPGRSRGRQKSIESRPDRVTSDP